MKPIFFYGTLRDRELLECVLGRPVSAGSFPDATASDAVTCLMSGEAYPTLLPKDGAYAHGRLLLSPSDADLARLAFYEEEEYGLFPLTVETAEGQVGALYFRGTDKRPPTEIVWDFDAWARNDRAAALHAAREYMSYFGKLTVAEVDAFWPSLLSRAYQRARAEAAPVGRGGLRSGHLGNDVEIARTEIAYSGFLTVEHLHLRHRRFDGDWSAGMMRSVARWGDAATLLPYDPGRDRVLLIEQFRPGPAARGDGSPWCIEVIAGRIDPGETAEQAARRESDEEGGVRIERIEAIPPCYPTPGMAAEMFYGFVGEADLPGTGGTHGKPDELEDIRTIVLPFHEAMEALASGEVNTAIAQISLHWLAANRERLRTQWSEGP